MEDKIAEIKEEKPVFNGIVVTNHGQFAGKFTLVYDDFYVNKTHELYDVACINTLPWQTLCIPYFYKMFKVEIVELPGFDPQEEIKEIKIDYASLANYIVENPLPVWNITNIKIKTGTYPDPCIDHVNYEHVLFRQNFKKNCEYMIISNDEKLKYYKKKSSERVYFFNYKNRISDIERLFNDDYQTENQCYNTCL